MTARPGGEAGPARRSEVFKRAARLLTESLDYESTLARVAALALPDFGAWSIVDVREPSGSFRRVAIVHPDPTMQSLARRLQGSWPPEVEDAIGAPAVARSGMPQVVTGVTDEMLIEFARDEENLRILRQLGIGAFIVVPLVSRGHVVGAITFVRGPEQQYTAEDVDIAEGLAAVSTMAIEHARIHQEAQEARNRAADRAEMAERQHRDLERIMEIQTRLVRGFSHDVKNPLGAAQGYAQLLEEGILEGLTQEQTRSVKRISAAIASAIGLIDDLVEYAKTRMDSIEVRNGPVDVGELVREIAEEYRGQIEAAGLALEVHRADLPIIRSDRVRVRAIMGNLMSNVVKYTPRGRIDISMALHEDGAPWPGEWIRVDVKDTGRGIPAESHEVVFQEFSRLEPDAVQGAGLGLAMSRWIADALGARITLKSAPGQGSTFTLWLPRDGPGDERGSATDGRPPT